MNALYQLGIYFYRLAAAVASLFNEKARYFHRGQKQVFGYLKQNFPVDFKVVWVHCASLGEFEQGRPLIEAIKKQHPQYKILLTFFSPSGYEIRKNYDQADFVCYLPVDTTGNVRRFLDLVNPQMAFFVKYEFWKNYMEELSSRNIPLFLVSAIFRPEQLFFKSGARANWYRNVLKSVAHFFVQNKQSAELLSKFGFTNYTITGDTRFDRVAEIAANRKDLPIVEQFKGDSQLLVVGSSWQPDEELLVAYLEQNPNVKMVFAPHEVKETNVKRLIGLVPVQSVRYTQAEKTDLATARVLIVDCIGVLSSIYRYADVAYIGGGFGVGIHNTLEAAIYNVPVLFGPIYLRFQEAVELVRRGLAFPVQTSPEVCGKLDELFGQPQTLVQIAEGCRQFMDENVGATQQILEKVFNN
ncbi:3-deoxy-D-manno-octulosonic acid transferase [Mangrovibacterium diazotrophicum]|uniref:3-deoxy-D-manno-octulosonic acid transferase n=1 Tax=Mangrovibacterium diazotrophicum TaxID=1261403 RepID=A0A419WAT1_9BACT|nr:glycosyltransferase N-terminal domain-containing protein [Mangrovibacterium diazotrophicum]RKD92591.1 3-deoxy-D-manno-octulosonic-acid transferase [Mangrovibacterium diazotrophicum]